jgi:hypothetical protein
VLEIRIVRSRRIEVCWTDDNALPIEFFDLVLNVGGLTHDRGCGKWVSAAHGRDCPVLVEKYPLVWAWQIITKLVAQHGCANRVGKSSGTSALLVLIDGPDNPVRFVEFDSGLGVLTRVEQDCPRFKSCPDGVLVLWPAHCFDGVRGLLDLALTMQISS